MKIVLFITLLCWRFLFAFTFFLVVIMAVPESAVWPSAAAVGFVMLALLAWIMYRMRQREGFELGWFLGVRKGYWHILAGLTGAALFITGTMGLIAPETTNAIAEQHAMKFAAALVFLFWMALIFMFLGWALACYSEAVGYLRLKNFKWSFFAFLLGSLWLVFELVCVSLFLGVINDNFLGISDSRQNGVLLAVAGLTMAVGLYAGRYADLKALVKGDEEARAAKESN